jgi:plasmid stabilization system protein ParE
MPNRLASGPSPYINIKLVEGELRLVGWENEEVFAKTDLEKDLTIQQEKDHFTLSCQGDLFLNAPKASKVHVLKVNGDMSVRGVAGDLEVEAVHGDLAMRDVGNVKLGMLEADFSLRRARGHVRARSVGGDASLRELGGNLKVNVEGDIVLQLDPQPDHKYSLVAGDDIMILLPPEVNASLTIHAEKIKLEWPGVEPQEGTSRVVKLGEGAAKVKLDAGGDVVVTNRIDAVESADEYGNFAGMMFDWGGFGRDLGERISRRAQEAAERAARKIETAGRRAGRDLRRGARDGLEVGRWKWDIPTGPSAISHSPVSDEERMTILRMLAEKKITAEEAESLLAALEGGE